MKAILLTAGLGTRLRPVTEVFAKPVVPFLNLPLMYYPMPLFEAAGVTHLVMNTHYLPAQIERAARALKDTKFSMSFSPEIEKPLGSGGGIWKARTMLEDSAESSFLVGNGDEVILPRNPGIIQKLVAQHNSSGAIATILTMPHPLVGTQFGGVWADANGRVAGFGKDVSQFPGTKGYHYIGLFMLSSRAFRFMPEGESNILYDTLARAIAEGERVDTIVDDFTWFETGNPKDFLHGTKEALQLLSNGTGEDANWLRETTRRFWPAGTELKRTDDGGSLLKAPTAHIDLTAETHGFVVLGDETALEERTIAKNVVLLPGAKLTNRVIANDGILLSS